MPSDGINLGHALQDAGMSKPPEVVGIVESARKEAGGRGRRSRRVLLWSGAALGLAALALAGFVGYEVGRCSPPGGSGSGSGRSGHLGADRVPREGARLPRNLTPRSYRLSLLPFLWEGNFTFSGRVSLEATLSSPADHLTLHAAELTLNGLPRLTKLTSGEVSDEGTRLGVASVKMDEEREFLLVFPAERLEPADYRLEMDFTGILNDALQGFYRSSYTVNNTTRWIATSQFQSTDARRAFPCLDEPALKAKFTISIGRPADMTAVSNMPKIGASTPVEELEGYEWDHFAESVPMSTYLVAFTVSDFESLSEGTFRVWARSGALEQARYALGIGPRILRHFEQFFQIPFPLPKMDMVALPDFAAGAMENWGLITYRENTMLYEEGVSTNKQKQRVGTVVAHELAHQWFGNLVTPAWWSDLWLNEGFATYIECIGVDVVEPSWRTTDQFVIQDLQSVLLLDAYKSSHPVSSTVSHPNEIDEIFDSISYAKGASIIRMMDHFLTTPVFKRGLTNYLKSREYSSATQDDLWSALTDQAHTDMALPKYMSVKEIMDTWTLKTGFPLVTVTRNYKDGSALVSQTRFGYVKGEEEKSNWWVPLSYTTQASPDFQSTRPSYWIPANYSITINSLGAQPNHWVIFNIKETGFYRVNYDVKNWKMLTAYLMDPKKFSQIGEVNRAQIIDDVLDLARAGKVNYSLALNLTKYLVHELEYIPWAAAFPAFSYIDAMINKMPVYDKFKNYFLGLFKRLYDETGFVDVPGDAQLNVYKRVDVLKWACYLSHHDCVLNAVNQFQNWRASPNPDRNNPISANVKATVYCSAIREGGQAEWEFAWERYLAANVGSEKSILLGALGCTRETWLLSRYLHWAITEGSGIRKQDAATVFGAVSTNIIGQPLAFAFLRDNWRAIKQYFGTTVFTINSIIRFTMNEMNTEFDLKMLKEFAQEHINELGSATKVVEQAIENAESNVAWMRDSYGEIEDWLGKYHKLS